MRLAGYSRWDVFTICFDMSRSYLSVWSRSCMFWCGFRLDKLVCMYANWCILVYTWMYVRVPSFHHSTLYLLQPNLPLPIYSYSIVIKRFGSFLPALLATSFLFGLTWSARRILKASHHPLYLSLGWSSHQKRFSFSFQLGLLYAGTSTCRIFSWMHAGGFGSCFLRFIPAWDIRILIFFLILWSHRRAEREVTSDTLLWQTFLFARNS